MRQWESLFSFLFGSKYDAQHLDKLYSETSEHADSLLHLTVAAGASPTLLSQSSHKNGAMSHIERLDWWHE